MLNSNIKIDLHIHSYASKYKEPNYEDGTSIVEESKLENIDDLLDKLIGNDITLFSITDHNRYDSALYKEILKKIKQDKYRKLNILHGIEFDVKLENNKETTHIISLFDVKDDNDIFKLEKIINENQLQKKSDAFTKEKFEEILKEIGLNTILIVHQRCNLDNSNGNHNSLSEGVSDPYRIIQIGYINALEYQKPNVEGILKNNLRNLDTNIALITGSDCHDWKVYPKHDARKHSSKTYFSKIKALPTFKGLLLSLTSPETRFNRRDSKNTDYIQSFSIGDSTIRLDSGINAIIGENGSGKSTIFNILNNNISKNYIKDLKKKNNIEVTISPDIQIKSINQAELVEKFQSGKLFYGENELFEDVDSTDFNTKYSNFSNNLKSNIVLNIQKNTLVNSLNNKNFEIDINHELTTTLYVSVTTEGLPTDENIHKEHRQKLSSILVSLINEFRDDYYSSDDKRDMFEAITRIKKVYDHIDMLDNSVEFTNKLKNIIINKCNEYTTEIEKLSTSEDQEILTYNTAKTTFVNEIVNAIKKNTELYKEVAAPTIIVGESRKRYNGYVFTREANYNKNDVLNNYFNFMFVSDYNNLKSLLSIKSKDEFKTALKTCTSIDKIDEIWTSNYSKFCEWAKTEKSYIKEESSDNSIGNTLGEMSLVYYKFQSDPTKEWNLLMIDQPEDNISNNRIAEKLLKYLNSVRTTKQLIIVTHNPLLVVNLDVDNVIHLTKLNDKIDVKAGCLEDEKNEILNLVASTLDGGKEMIEKRLKIYE